MTYWTYFQPHFPAYLSGERFPIVETESYYRKSLGDENLEFYWAKRSRRKFSRRTEKYGREGFFAPTNV